MVTEKVERVKFWDLGTREKINCMEQYVNIICPYEWFDDEPLEYLGEDIEWFVSADPNQFYFDKNGDWYDEGRKVR